MIGSLMVKEMLKTIEKNKRIVRGKNKNSIQYRERNEPLKFLKKTTPEEYTEWKNGFNAKQKNKQITMVAFSVILVIIIGVFTKPFLLFR